MRERAPAPSSRSIALIRGLVILSLALIAAVAGLRLGRDRAPLISKPADEVAPLEPRLVLVPAAIEELAGWSDDPLDGLAGALARSCTVLAEKGAGPGGPPADWRRVCS